MSRIALARLACLLALAAAARPSVRAAAEENPSLPQADAAPAEKGTFIIVGHGPHSAILLDTRNGQTWRLTGGNDEWEWIETKKDTDEESAATSSEQKGPAPLNGEEQARPLTLEEEVAELRRKSRKQDEETRKLKNKLEKTMDRLAEAHLAKTNGLIAIRELQEDSQHLRELLDTAEQDLRDDEKQNMMLVDKVNEGLDEIAKLKRELADARERIKVILQQGEEPKAIEERLKTLWEESNGDEKSEGVTAH